jgi:hypothetical protein
MGIEEIYSEEFKKQFWTWFDDLPKSEADMFRYYKNDMSELYFYNKIYSKKEFD